MKTAKMSINLIQVTCYSIEILLSAMFMLIFYENVKLNFLRGDFTFSMLSIIAAICTFAVLVRRVIDLCTIDIEDVGVIQMNKVDGFAIKLPNGNYYGGYGKPDKLTLIGAQTFDSKRTAEALIRRSKRFNCLDRSEVTIIEVVLEEKEHNNN